MPTTYDLVSSLFERIIGADLIVVGTVRRLKNVQHEDSFKEPRVFGFFEIDVERALKGEPPPNPVLLRVFGEGRNERPKWAVPLKEGARVLLLLARDVAPDLPPNLFAPYFASGFTIDEQGRVEVPPDVLDTFSKRAARFEGRRARLAEFERLVKRAQAERERQVSELKQFIPPAILRRRYPGVLEQPGVRRDAEEPVAPGLAPQPEAGAGGREGSVRKLPGSGARKTRRRRSPGSKTGR